MIKKILYGLGMVAVGFLALTGTVKAAPTSTVVQNLFITGIAGGGTECLHILNSGLVQPTTGTDCSSGSGGASTTVIVGINGITVNQVGVNATASLNTAFSASWTALESFLKGATINGTTTLASTTNCSIVKTDSSGNVGCGSAVLSVASSATISASAATGSSISFSLLQSYLTAALQSLNGATSSAQTLVGGTGASVTTVAGATNSTTTITNTGVTSFNGATGTVTYAPSTTIPTLYVVSLNGVSGTISIVGTGSTTVNTSGTIITINSTSTTGSGIGTVTTSSAVTINNVPFWTSDGKLAGTSTVYYASSTGSLLIGTTTNNGGAFEISSSNGIRIDGTQGSANFFLAGYTGGTEKLGIYFSTNGATAFQSFSNVPLSLNPQGNKVGVGTESPVSSFSISGPVVAGATSALENIGNILLQNGNVSGTYVAINAPSGFNGDLVNYQVNSSTVFGIASSGIPTVSAITNALILTNSVGKFVGYIATTCSGGQAVTGVSATGTLTCSTFATSTSGVTGGGITTSSQGSYGLGNVAFFINSSTASGDSNFNWATSTQTLTLSVNAQPTIINAGNNLTINATGSLALYENGANFLVGAATFAELLGPNGTNNITLSNSTGATVAASAIKLNSTVGTIVVQNNGGNTATISVTGLTANRIINLPDNPGTLVLTTSSTVAGNCVKWTATSTIGDAGSACGSGGGTGTVTTSTGFTANTIPIINGATSIGNSTLTQPGGGVTSVNGVPFIDGAGDFIGPNIFTGVTSTAALGNVNQAGGVQTYNTTTTLTGAQFLAGGEVDILNTTGSITITIPSTSTIYTAAASAGIKIYASSFSVQSMVNNSTNTVFVAVTGTGEQQEFTPGTPTSLSPGQQYWITGQFVNSSTQLAASSTLTQLIITYQLAQTSTPTNGFAYFNAAGGLVVTSTPSGSGGTSTTTVTTSWTVGASGSSFTTIQPALDACATAGGGQIDVKGGTYAQGGTGLLWKGSNCKLYGVNGTTTVTFTGATTGFAATTTTSTAAAFSHNEIHNITILMDGNTGGTAIDESNMSHNIYDNIVINNVGTCLKFHDTVDITFYNQTDEIDCTTVIKFGIDGSSTEPWNGNIFSDNFLGCSSSGCVGEAIGNSEHNLFFGDRIEPPGAPTAGTIGIKIFDSNTGTNPGNFGNTWFNPYIEGNAIAINVSSGVSCGSGECISGDSFYGGISDQNGTINVPTSTGVSFYNFNKNFTPITVLTSHLAVTGQTAAPTVSACGTTPTMDPQSNDTVGLINTGSGSPTSCTLTFAASFTVAPQCFLNVNTTSTLDPDIFSISTSALTIHFATSLTSGKVGYFCISPGSQG